MIEIKTKICSKKDCQFAGQEQDISNFSFSNKKKGIYEARCKLCVKKYNQDHKEELAEYQAQYREDHKEEKSEYQAQYYQDHKEEFAEYMAQYKQDNKEDLALKRREYENNKLEKDPVFKFRKNFSCLFRQYIKSNNIGKGYNSTYKILGITPDEIREYLYAQFSHPDNLDNNGKVWMTPENQGIYKKSEWDENDSSTWKWQVDHIKPQSEFECTSLNDPKLKECWALTNLRPYRADLNLKDGVNRTRHIQPCKIVGQK